MELEVILCMQVKNKLISNIRLGLRVCPVFKESSIKSFNRIQRVFWRVLYFKFHKSTTIQTRLPC